MDKLQNDGDGDKAWEEAFSTSTIVAMFFITLSKWRYWDEWVDDCHNVCVRVTGLLGGVKVKPLQGLCG